MKVWDISKSKPTCISETEAKIGMVHALDGCPDAPFVFAFGGDTPSHNMHVMDVRESAKGKINNVVIKVCIIRLDHICYEKSCQKYVKEFFKFCELLRKPKV